MINEFVEQIAHNNQILAYIILSEFLPERTTFLTPPGFKQQVDFVVYPKSGEIVWHVHRPLDAIEWHL